MHLFDLEMSLSVMILILNSQVRLNYVLHLNLKIRNTRKNILQVWLQILKLFSIYRKKWFITVQGSIY